MWKSFLSKIGLSWKITRFVKTTIYKCNISKFNFLFPLFIIKNITSSVKEKPKILAPRKHQSVFKEKWSRTELDEIVAGCDCCAILSWMLPNIDRMLTEEEVQEFYTINDSIYEFERARKPLDCNQILNKINDLEAIGCFSDGGNSILWTNPSTPEKLDSVVKNLKKLCLELQVKLEEA